MFFPLYNAVASPIYVSTTTFKLMTLRKIMVEKDLRFKNASVTKRAQIIWLKILEVVRLWKGLPKSKQPGKGKIGQSTSFDCLAKAVDDPTIPLKLRFFEEIAMSLNDFLVTFETDNPMVPFMTESLDNVLRTLCGRFLRKYVLEEPNLKRCLLILDLKPCRS